MIKTIKMAVRRWECRRMGHLFGNWHWNGYVVGDRNSWTRRCLRCDVRHMTVLSSNLHPMHMHDSEMDVEEARA